jgi:SAM-dependent methyltransferase
VYSRSAHLYDMIYRAAGKDYAADAESIDALVREHNPTAQALLDVACGTGRHLTYLQRHYQVEGVDVDAAMVEQARRTMPRVTFGVADMRTLALGRRFDVVICLFSAIGHILDDTEFKETITRMAQHLRPRGILIIDGWVRPEDWASRPPAVISAEEGELRVIRMGWTRREGDLTFLEMHHLVGDADGVEYFREDHVLRLRPDAATIALMEEAGLRTGVVSSPLHNRSRFVGVAR